LRRPRCEWKTTVYSAVIGILIAASSCTPTLYKEPIDVETVPAREWSREELFQSLTERVERFQSLRSLASVHYQGKDGRGKFQEAIVVQRPDKLRLETLSSFGVLLVVTANGDKVAGFDPRENFFVHGKSSKENLVRLTRIPLELREIAALLMGLPPVAVQGHWEGKQNILHRKLQDGRSEMVAFHSKLGIPTQWERSGPNGEIELSAFFSDFSSTPAGPFPLKISLEAPAQQKRVEIRYQEPELNVDLSPGLFVLEKPAHVREMPIESLGG
jgi:outer membrane lipoprotein-sorting protein